MAFILSTGRALPSIYLPNSEMTQFPESSLFLIEKKTGVKGRYKIASGESTSTLALQAAKNCIEKIGFSPEKIDVIILATSTPDKPMPSIAAKLAHELGAKNAFAFDVNSVSSGSLVVLQQARSMISSNFAKNVLVIAADSYSTILNEKDFSTFPFFGDGSGAALLSSETESSLEIFDGVFHSDGAFYETVTVLKTSPDSAAKASSSGWKFKMDGRDVYNFAVSKAPEVIRETLEKYKINLESVSKLICHQSNINILKAMGEALGVGFEKFFVDLDTHGNMAGASVLFALDDYLESNKPESGSSIVLCSYGGGLTWGASILKVK